jgi:hypothetical protein
MIFLAKRDGLDNKRIHRRIKNRLQSDSQFSSVQLRVSTHREPGPYRVIAKSDPRDFLEDSNYPVESVRLEIGFDVEVGTDNDYYWISWIEPERNLLLGWHQDDDHPEHGEVHFQLSQSDGGTLRESAEYIDKHPMAVVEARLDQLGDVVQAITWDNGTATGVDW